MFESIVIPFHGEHAKTRSFADKDILRAVLGGFWLVDLSLGLFQVVQTEPDALTKRVCRHIRRKHPRGQCFGSIVFRNASFFVK
jgi:hypothetical protein